MVLKIDKEAYLQRLLERVEGNRISGISRTVRINEKINQEIVNYILDYFKNKPDYRVEIIKCRNCKNVWDIVIHNSNK